MKKFAVLANPKLVNMSTDFNGGIYPHDLFLSLYLVLELPLRYPISFSYALTPNPTVTCK